MALRPLKRLYGRYDRLPNKYHLVIVLVAVMMVLLPFASSGRDATGGLDSDALGDGGFQGVGDRDVVPLSKATLVAFDPAGLDDDLAYLAAVPAATFRAEGGTMASSPLLFYQPPMASPSDQETALDAGVGVEHLMEDHVTACGGGLETLMTVGVPASEAEGLQAKWSAHDLVTVAGGPAVAAAARLAEANWEWADTAVVAVLDPSVGPVERAVRGNVSGTVPSVAPASGQFTGEISPSFHAESFHDFDVGEEYRYISAELTWDVPGPFPDLTQRGKELGLHLYAGDIMVALSTEWNCFTGSRDTARSFVYVPGPWRAGVVFIPTMGVLDAGFDGPSWAQRVFEPARYTLTYDLYGGVDVPLDDIPAPGAREGVFTLTWQDTSRSLGLFVRGPSGQELAASLVSAGPGELVLEVPELGTGLYTASVVDMDGQQGEVPFQLDYSWEEPMSPAEVEGLVGATEAAVLASMLNAPLLYGTPDGLPGPTGRALDTLGTGRVLLVDLTGHSGRLERELRDLRGAGQRRIAVERTFTDAEALVRYVAGLGDPPGPDRQDVVFTTLDPWSYWYTDSNDDNPQGEEWGGRYFGPAAYAAANHQCPVLVTEMDSRLSCSNAYHNVYWHRAYRGRGGVPVAAMYFTGQQVYDALGSYGLDADGMESVVTVAGQFEIGTAWDRALVGASTPGRIAGTPVDASVWTSRAVLYPHLVFANPAVDPSLDPHDGMRIVGSSSTRTAGVLRITEPEREVRMDAPVAFTWACYIYKFNERAAEYWGAQYHAADGTVPGVSPSDHPWDGGTLPDICEDEFEAYSSRAGYGEAEAAGYDATLENLNRGVVMWFETMHGSNGGSGFLGWWSSTKNAEADPHRAYEEYPKRFRGSTSDPDVVTLDKYTGLDTTPSTGPITPIGLLPERHDGVVIAYINQDPQTDGVRGLGLDADLESLHSMGLVAGSCSISNTFLHLSLVRHGCVFQIIDPWLTSWYVQLGSEVFYRDVGYGECTVGEAYDAALSKVGAKYVTEEWWWDHWENIVFFGDPDIRVYTPHSPIPRPPVEGRSLVVEGHAVMGARDHPAAVGGSGGWAALQWVGALVLVVEAGRFALRRGYLSALSRRTRRSRSTA